MFERNDRLKRDDFNIGGICAVNILDDAIDIQIELIPTFESDCLEQVFVSWTIKDDYSKPESVEVLTRTGSLNVDDVKLTSNDKSILLSIVKSHINKYGLKEY